MEYANKGNLRECLVKITNEWKQKLVYLYRIISGLNEIHKKDFIHSNFHDGNILCNKYNQHEDKYIVYISDYLELYQLAKSYLKNNNIYGVIPFIAPEVLRGEFYTQASDIYSFSIIMWEFTSGVSPFNDKAYDIQLGLNICKGERPKIIENTPQCYVNLMKRCWDEDQLKRPSASEISDIIKKWIFKSENINDELKSNIMEFINAPIGYSNLISNDSHSQAYYTSHLLDFTSKELNEILLKQKNIEQKTEFAKKENTLQTQITYLQNEKHTLTLQLEQNKQMEQQFQFQIKQLKQEKINLQEKLTQTETNIQELKFQQDQYKNQLIQFQNNYKQIEDKNIKLEKIAEIYYQYSQNELINLQQRNFQFEQNNSQFEQANQKLKLQIKEFSEKENILQTQITYLQNTKYTLAEQLKQNKTQISQLEQEKVNLQEKLIQIEANIQKLNSQQDQYKNQLTQFQNNYKQIENENFKLEKIAETYYQYSQNKLINLQQKNFQFEQNNQKLRQDNFQFEQVNQILIQSKEFAEKENTKQINQYQIQINQLEQKKDNLQEKLIQTEANIQELQDQYKNQLIHFQSEKETFLNKVKEKYQTLQKDLKVQFDIEMLQNKLKITMETKTTNENEKAKLQENIDILNNKLDKAKELKIKLEITSEMQQKEIKNLNEKLDKTIKLAINKPSSQTTITNLTQSNQSESLGRFAKLGQAIDNIIDFVHEYVTCGEGGPICFCLEKWRKNQRQKQEQVAQIVQLPYGTPGSSE